MDGPDFKQRPVRELPYRRMGVFLWTIFVSALNLIPANRPPVILIGVSLYFAISLVALICVLMGSRSDDLLAEEAG